MRARRVGTEVISVGIMSLWQPPTPRTTRPFFAKKWRLFGGLNSLLGSELSEIRFVERPFGGTA